MQLIFHIKGYLKFQHFGLYLYHITRPLRICFFSTGVAVVIAEIVVLERQVITNNRILQVIKFLLRARIFARNGVRKNVLVVKVASKLSLPWLIQLGIFVFQKLRRQISQRHFESKYDKYCMFLCKMFLFCLKVPLTLQILFRIIFTPAAHTSSSHGKACL